MTGSSCLPASHTAPRIVSCCDAEPAAGNGLHLLLMRPVGSCVGNLGYSVNSMFIFKC